MPGDAKCKVLTEFFVGALKGCRKLGYKSCMDHPFGYKSCSWSRSTERCTVRPCWAHVVNVMTECPEFFPALAPSFVGKCQASSKVKGDEKSYTLGKYKALRENSGHDGLTGKCYLEPRECSKACGDQFNFLWDSECKAFVQEFVDQDLEMKKEFVNWVDKCDVRRPELTNWLMIGTVITAFGVLFFAIGFFVYRYTMQKREGASETDISMVGTWRSKQQKKEQQNKLQEEENDI